MQWNTRVLLILLIFFYWVLKLLIRAQKETIGDAAMTSRRENGRSNLISSPAANCCELTLPSGRQTLSLPPSYKTLPFCSVPGCTDFNGTQRRLELLQWKRQRGSETGVEGRMKQTDGVGDRGKVRCTGYWEGQVGRHVPGKTGRGERWKWEKRGVKTSLIKKKGTAWRRMRRAHLS